MIGINAPLYNALVQFTNRNPISFHVPGHKNGDVLVEEATSYFKGLLQLDLTELTGLDDLHSPDGVIAEAQSLAAKFYGVKSSYFLVNGTTVGNLSMILATCKAGDRVIVQRNCHKSIMHGLTLAKAKPVFIAAQEDLEAGFQTGVSINVVERAIEMYPDSKAIILTNPNYYGTTLPLKGIIDVAHKNNIPVLVDEAHGAHFSLGSPYPESAITQGADVVVQSAHKTLPAMTMGSYLHFNSKLVVEDKVKFYLSVLQSSSPSYPIMASLDLARTYLETIKNDKVKQIAEDHMQFKQMLQEIPGLKLIESNVIESKQDPLKIILQAEGETSGFALKEMLEKELIYPEMADHKNVLFVLPLGFIKNKDVIIEKISNAVKGVISLSNDKKTIPTGLKYEPISEICFSYEEMDDCPTQLMDLLEAKGKVSSENIIPYPPGIPLIMCGERITGAHIKNIIELQELGAVFQGNENLKLNKINVFTHRGD